MLENAGNMSGQSSGVGSWLTLVHGDHDVVLGFDMACQKWTAKPYTCMQLKEP
jgi:hypothetical protein